MHNLRRLTLLLAPLALAACTTVPASLPASPSAAAISPAGGVAAANDPRVGPIGEAIMARGGSATDAAVAMMLALAVLEPQSSGIGGGGLLLVGDPDGSVDSFDGRETAPGVATSQWFLNPDGSVRNRQAATLSGLSVGVPGAVALAAEAHRQHGRLPWAELFAPAIELARDGFPVTPRLSSSLASFAPRGGRDADARAAFYHADGSAPLPGEVIRLPVLAQTLEMIATLGPDSFYHGPFAQGMAAEIAADTPLPAGMTAQDIADYRPVERDPACTLYRLHRICTMGPPSSGGVALLAMLKQLERFDLAALGPRNPVTWHLFIESQRLAYADRELYVGDPAFVDVPLAGLLDEGYLAARSALISADSTMASAGPGQPAGASLALAAPQAWPENGTTHFVAVEADGTMASFTATVEGAFGSGLMYRGFYLNNELTDFAFAPEVGGRVVANVVAAGKRPASSMTPTLVYDPQGRPLFALGAAGGGLIPPQTARAIIGVIDFHMPLEEALGLPFVMAVGPGTVLVEKGTWMEGLAPDLQRLGHAQVNPFDQLLRTTGALRGADGRWQAAFDPRLAPLVAIPATPTAPAGPGQSEGLGPNGAH
jgi:gamma-glutamyltranspeptidase/glutathione hydrolase